LGAKRTALSIVDCFMPTPANLEEKEPVKILARLSTSEISCNVKSATSFPNLFAHDCSNDFASDKRPDNPARRESSTCPTVCFLCGLFQ